MKNPLFKRLPRELKQDFGKYAVIFLFMVATIGFVSGFLVADNSMQMAYGESFTKYNIEDGHFLLGAEAKTEFLNELEQEEDIWVYENFYKEETAGATTYRIFINRSEINRISLLEGELAKTDSEIAVDRLFAENNKIAVGDTIQIQGKAFTVCGLAAFSDYSALFRSNADMMFDAQNFTVAAVTEDAFAQLPDTHLNYCYSWKYRHEELTDQTKRNRAEELMKDLAAAVPLSGFVAEEDNQAIHFTGDDMGSDEAMMVWLLYIVIVIMAFVFGVTTTNTIEQEAAVIGTLRASGYKRGELVGHYLLLPVIVTLMGAGVGNLLGYTAMKNVVVGMYYGSYSLPPYETVWSGYAFVMTTVIPCLIMLLVNLFILCKKLSRSPLQFLRRELKKNKNERAVRLPNFKFMSRFRIRVILQNRYGYAILFVGILFANVILLFGMMMTPLLEHYKENVINTMICDYQYILKAPFETEEASAEKYAVTTLETNFAESDLSDEITVYGIEDTSDYLPISFDSNHSGVYVSDGILEKYGLTIGDTVLLKTKYEEDTYSFTITGHYPYPASLAVFISRANFCETFDKEPDFFSGYFSNQELEDLEEAYIATAITQSDMTILSDQLFDSMGSMFPMVSGFAVLLYMLLVYLQSKLIIEKNASSVSMVKILGYQNKEITQLYIASTAVVVGLSVLVSIPLAYLIIKLLYAQIISSFSGWLSFYIAPVIYVKMFLLGVVSYAVVGALQFRKIKKIPMEEALKNAE